MSSSTSPSPRDGDPPGAAAGDWLDPDQQSAWRALVLGTTLLFDRLDDELREAHGVSWVEYEILVRLSEAGGRLRMAQLADSLAHSRSRVTHTIKRMEASRVVERRTSPEDGRGVEAILTSSGRDLIEQLAPLHVEGVRQHLVDLVDADDLAAVGRVFDAVADRLVTARPGMEIR